MTVKITFKNEEVRVIEVVAKLIDIGQDSIIIVSAVSADEILLKESISTLEVLMND